MPKYKPTLSRIKSRHKSETKEPKKPELDGNNPPNGPIVLQEIKTLQKSSDGKGIRAGWWGGKNTKKNKNRKTRRYTKPHFSKLNKRYKTRKIRISH
jgi:hypothetical protein